MNARFIVRVACGSYHSAAIAASGELFTWGRGAGGRLGLGHTEDQLTPALVTALKPNKIVDAACGCGSAHTLAVTDLGQLLEFRKRSERFRRISKNFKNV